MKHTTTVRRVLRPLSAVLFAVLMLGPAAARAAECPASSPEDAQERKKLAKEWFAAAQQAEDSGDNAEATRAFACSYKMVAHPNTAFNLGRVAEHSGDNDLALKMFKAYLTLKPDAADRDDVKMRIKGIEDKIAAAAAPPAETTPEGSGENQVEPPAEEPQPVAPPPAAVTKRPQPEPEPQAPPSHALEWVVGGVAVATLVVGMGLNLAARSKMSACQADADKGQLATANDECESAKPLAYTSYALFGVAAAGIVTDALLLILRNNAGSASSSGDEASLGLMPLPGGAGLTARGRF